MKTGALIAIVAATLTATGIGTLSALRDSSAPNPEAVSPTPVQPRPDDSTLTTPTEIAQEDTATDLAPTVQDELRDFPHRPIRLVDEVPAGSDFDQFRQQFRQALRDRNETFILPLLPMLDEQTIAYGFGLLELSEARLDQPHSWFWSVLDKAMVLGCVAESAAPYGEQASDADVIWICPGTMNAFEEQYPAPVDAEGIDHYLDSVMVFGENVNVRDRPSTEGTVIALLSNEVVDSDPEGWQQLYDQQGDDAVYDPIDGWTPVTVPNGKTGFVYSRYTYYPLETRLFFGKANGQWQIILMPSGD